MSKRARERIVVAAQEVVSEVGWTGLTMARIADRAGVSRQTVYNAVTSKSELARLVVRREFETFLERIEAAIEPHPADLAATLESAVTTALTAPPDLRMLSSLAAAWGTSPEDCLGIVLEHQATLLRRARRRVERLFGSFEVSAPAHVQRAMADLLVRATFTHALAPSEPPESVARTLAWVVGRALGVEVPDPEPAPAATG